MKKKLFYLVLSLIVGLVLVSACSDNEDEVSAGQNPFGGGSPIASGDTTATGRTVSEGWSIPISQVFGGGPGKDGIPSIDNPNFVTASQADNFLAPTDLVVGFKVGDVVRAYPHRILDWHEIINDELNGVPIAITYCPLTGTAIGWDRMIEGQVTTFGVSGLLYNTNLIPYDRLTDSNWSQILIESVNGNQIGNVQPTYTLVETTWQTWKDMFPETDVVSTDTGFSRDYNFYPYGDYRTNNEFLLFPVANMDERRPSKERVLGVISGEDAKLYPIGFFEVETTIFHDTFNGKELVVVGSQGENFAVAFERNLEDGTQLTFTPVNNQGSVVMTDNEGNSWNIFGEAVSGPRTGEQLTQTESYIGFFFTFGSFYPNPEIFSDF